ncbi:MAG: hypothetical protein K2W96_16300 [Gemmataceae bacterium]|nr:hypothetical protein [Gemmataceae bacterium]
MGATMMAAYPRLLAVLEDVRRQWRTQQVLRGSLLALGGTLAVLLLSVIADNLLHLPVGGRVALSLLLWGSLAGLVLGFVVRKVVEDRRDDYFASLVERRYPAMRNSVINALQLGRDNTPGFSKPLIEAIVADADKALAQAEAGEAVDRRPTRRAAWWLLGVVGALALYAGVFQARFLNGLARVLLPVAAIDPYTRTRVTDVAPGDSKVPEGQPVTITAKAEGVPQPAWLYRKGASGTWTGERMAGEDGAFSFKVPQAGSSFDYYVLAGDGRSPTYRIEAVRPPQVERLSVEYTLPAYAGSAVRRVESSDGEVAGVAGTVAKLELVATKPLRKAVLVMKDGKEVELAAEGGKHVGRFTLWIEGKGTMPGMEGQITVDAPTAYQLRMEDTDGYANNDPLWRAVVLKPDAAPEVVLRAPEEQMQVQAGTAVPLAVEAMDDLGLDKVRLLYRVGAEEKPHVLKEWGEAKIETRLSQRHEWRLSESGLKKGDKVEYWAEATDRNNITGPGRAESRRYRLEVVDPKDLLASLDTKVKDYATELKKLIAMQRQNRAETDGGTLFKPLAERQKEIRKRTGVLARSIEDDGVPLRTVIDALDGLVVGPMAAVLKDLESGAITEDDDAASKLRKATLPHQDKIIAVLEDILTRLLRNEEAKKAIRRMQKEDPKGHKTTLAVLAEFLKDVKELLKDQTELGGKFEKLTKKEPDAIKDELLKARMDLDELGRRKERWAKGSVQEMTKLPKGFTDDFDLRKEANKVFEEIEKAKEKAKAEKIEVGLEDLGAGLATKMKEDLESWLMDAPDSAKWVLEEPLNKKPMKIPEMPLPKALQDLVGELLQKADEFDEDADDITSAWGDNLDQAGWGTSDGPISTFSAKGKTGNDMPNNMELNGRSGDGRRGKSTGQMTGDTSKALPGRKTPARVGDEKYEPGRLKTEAQEDPNGATGGGKKSGTGRRGLQGGSPPDVTKEIGRLSAKQAGMRDKMEQVARKLESQGVSTTRLREGIKLLDEGGKDLADRKYSDAAKKRREAMTRLREGFAGLDTTTAGAIGKARELPPELRKQLLQGSEAGYPAGYEALLRSYYKALSASEK